LWELLLCGRLRRSVTFHTVRASVRSLQELQEALHDTEPPAAQRGMIQSTLNSYYMQQHARGSQQAMPLSVLRSALPPPHPRAYQFEFQRQQQHQQQYLQGQYTAGTAGGGAGDTR
jgi:hypothetical protein